MEPNKLENEFRKQLNQRSIQPSANSWDRLDAMLTVAEHKSKRSFKWLYVAASFVGFTLLGFFLLNQEKSELQIVPQNNVVVEEKQPLKVEESPIVLEDISNQRTRVATVVFDEKKAMTKTKINPKKEEVLDIALIKTATVEEERPSETFVPKLISAQSLLASVENGEKLTTTSVLSTSKVKVDANALLSTVEQEVDESFREKAIQTLNKNYKSVKSMLVNRNDQ